jgi:hypothetical protein
VETQLGDCGHGDSFPSFKPMLEGGPPLQRPKSIIERVAIANIGKFRVIELLLPFLYNLAIIHESPYFKRNQIANRSEDHEKNT